MITIWKYTIPPDARFQLTMPMDAQVLHVDVQDSKPFLWAQVNSALPMRTYYFVTVATDQELPGNGFGLTYHGTYQLVGLGYGVFVGHIYQEYQQ
jgi:hypothetical protein